MAMIINVARKDIYESIASLQTITSKKSTIAILSNILIETKDNKIIITATDLEVGIRTEIPAEILSPGSITLPSKKIFEIIRETKIDFLKIEISDNNWAKIITEDGVYRLAGTDSEEYPSFPEFEEEMLSTVSSDIMCEIIEKTIISVASDGESQFNLTGGLFEKEVRDDKNYLRVISSDGHRLTFMEREVDTDISKINLEKVTIVPKKGMQEIKKLSENEEFIELGFDEKQVILKTDKSILIIRLLNGDFPDYRNILKAIESETFIEIDKNQIVSSLKRINIFTEDLYNTVEFKFSDDYLELNSQSMDIGSGKEKIAVSYNGDDMNLGFNGKYFVEALQVMSSKKIQAFIRSEKSPCLLKGEEDPGFMAIIMPMAI